MHIFTERFKNLLPLLLIVVAPPVPNYRNVYSTTTSSKAAAPDKLASPSVSATAAASAASAAAPAASAAAAASGRSAAAERPLCMHADLHIALAGQ